MQTALITGGGGMLGRGAAQCLIGKGWRVVLADVDITEATKVAAELGGPEKATVEKIDANDLADCNRVVAKVVQDFGRLDGLVTAAGGHQIPRVNFIDSAPEHWDQFITLVLKTVLNANHAALPVMIGQGGGAIVNIASGAGLRGGPPQLRQKQAVVYGACKAGIIAHTQSVAQEVGPQGVRVNCVAPGRTASRRKSAAEMEAMEKAEESRQEGSSRQAPLGRRLTNMDIGNAIAFLLSDRASHVTGSCIDVSGGIRMW